MTDSRGARGKGYSTPEKAALAGFALARVVRVDAGDWARSMEPVEDWVVVELAVNEPPMEHHYFVHVHREGNLWFEGLSHN